jgi:mannosyltransferase OCH1-like enzyme
MSIPHLLHQIWIGPKSAPAEWMNTWTALHPDWEHRVWSEADIDTFGLQRRDLYDRYVADGCLNGAANVARVEIMLRHGGVYVDADLECVRSLGDAWFMRPPTRMWVVRSPHNPGRLSNAVFGAVPGHWALAAYQRALGGVTDLHPSWRRTGGELMTRHCLHGCRWLSATSFLPTTMYGSPTRGPKVDQYGFHHWATSRGVW